MLDIVVSVFVVSVFVDCVAEVVVQVVVKVTVPVVLVLDDMVEIEVDVGDAQRQPQ